MAKHKTVEALNEAIAKANDIAVVKEEKDNFIKVNEADLYTTDKDIETAIGKAGVTAFKLKHMLQLIACSIIKRIGETNDIRLASKCIETLAQHGLRKAPMLKFFTDYAPIKLDEKNQLMFDKKREGKIRLADAMTTPWWKAAGSEKMPTPLNFIALLESAVKRAETRREKIVPIGDAAYGITAEGDFLPADGLLKARQLVDFLKKEQAKAESSEAVLEATTIVGKKTAA